MAMANGSVDEPVALDACGLHAVSSTAEVFPPSSAVGTTPDDAIRDGATPSGTAETQPDLDGTRRGQHPVDDLPEGEAKKARRDLMVCVTRSPWPKPNIVSGSANGTRADGAARPLTGDELSPCRPT
jgi:hypothetical protein